MAKSVGSNIITNKQTTSALASLTFKEVSSLDQGGATCGPQAKSGPGVEILWPAERFRFENKQCGFEKVLLIFSGWSASCLTRRT